MIRAVCLFSQNARGSTCSRVVDKVAVRVGLEGVVAVRLSELVQRPGLDLADPFASDVEESADLFQRVRLAPEAEAQADHLALAVVERRGEEARDVVGEEGSFRALVGRRGVVRHDFREVHLRPAAAAGARTLQARLALLRRVHGDGHVLTPFELGHLRRAHVEPSRELGVGGLSAELDGELAAGLLHRLNLIVHVHGQPNRARLVRDAAHHRLLDPPRRVRGELEAALRVELLNGSGQAEGAFLDDVRKVESAVLVPLRDRNHQP
mmetsp:Transcript_15016/g.50378  ORF Transcript_15016/g.50378 Transcript_15016/m.50378 type:complete len:266 (-) Transcript_15016:731-1528(-)